MSKIKVNERIKIRNVSKSRGKVKLTFFKNILDGNIIDEPINFGPATCTISLDYSCPDNSQYVVTIT